MKTRFTKFITYFEPESKPEHNFRLYLGVGELLYIILISVYNVLIVSPAMHLQYYKLIYS